MPQLDMTTYFVQGIVTLVVLTLFFVLAWFGRLTYLYSFSVVPDFVFFSMRSFIFPRSVQSYSLFMIAGSLAYLNLLVNVSVLPAVRRPLVYSGW